MTGRPIDVDTEPRLWWWLRAAIGLGVASLCIGGIGLYVVARGADPQAVATAMVPVCVLTCWAMVRFECELRYRDDVGDNT